MKKFILKWLTDRKISIDKPVKRRYFIQPIMGEEYETSKWNYYLNMLPFVAIIILSLLVPILLVTIIIRGY